MVQSGSERSPAETKPQAHSIPLSFVRGQPPKNIPGRRVGAWPIVQWRQSPLVLPGRAFHPCALSHSGLDTFPCHPEAAFSGEGRRRPVGSALKFLAKWRRRCLQVTLSREGSLLSLREPQGATDLAYIPTLTPLAVGAVLLVTPHSEPHAP